MHKLNKAVKNLDLANAICDIVVNYYGEHNYNDFINVVNSRFRISDNDKIERPKFPENRITNNTRPFANSKNG